MKIIFNYILYTALFVIAIKATAQDKKPIMQKAPLNVNVDGKLTEWGDSLAMYDAKTKLNYTIANNDTALFIVAYVTNKQLKRKIMAGGITISVNGEGKRHKTSSITYPIPDKNAFTYRSHDENGGDDDLPKPSLIESTSIRVAGFKDVESDVITTNNTYGFKAAIGFDDKHNMIYETAIPLNMIGIKKGKNANDIAVNISVNGVERSKSADEGQHSGMNGGGMGSGGGMGGGRGMGGGGRGMGGGQHGGGRGGNRSGGDDKPTDSSGMSQSADFWVQLGLSH